MKFIFIYLFIFEKICNYFYISKERENAWHYKNCAISVSSFFQYFALNFSMIQIYKITE